MATSALTRTSYDTYGDVSETKGYDFGGSSPVADATITYAVSGSGSCSNIGAYIDDRPCSIVVKDSSNSIVAQTNVSYDTNGNQLSSSRLVTGSTYLTSSAMYNANGTVNVATDVNGAQTSYTYGACNGLLPTNVAMPLNLSRQMTWDCNGGVVTSSTDENGQTTSFSYTANGTDPFWRIKSTTDALSNTTSYAYTPTTFESVLTFNSGASTVDVWTALDGLGRAYITQRKQSPGATSGDTIRQYFDSDGRLSAVSTPFSCSWQSTSCSGGINTNYSYDALNRTAQIADGGGGAVSYCWGGTSGCPSSGNDVLFTLGLRPTERIRRNVSTNTMGWED
jgi:YD repeat-containing protein